MRAAVLYKGVAAYAKEKKLNVMRQNDFAGVAFWKAGLEKEAVWDVIASYTDGW